MTDKFIENAKIRKVHFVELFRELRVGEKKPGKQNGKWPWSRAIDSHKCLNCFGCTR